MGKTRIEVAAGAVMSSDGKQVLLALRRADQHQGNLWEFPGGKIEAHENPEAALKRELLEEIGITSGLATELVTVVHDYSDKAVRLHAFVVTTYSGEPIGLEGQSLRWVPLEKLRDYAFPEANEPILEELIRWVGSQE